MTKDYGRYKIVIEVTGELHPDIHMLYGQLRELLVKDFMDMLPKMEMYEDYRLRSDVLVDNTRKESV